VHNGKKKYGGTRGPVKMTKELNKGVHWGREGGTKEKQ